MATLYQDVLYEIFPYLDPDQYTGSGAREVRRILLASAMTCRNFLSPALDILWRSLPSDEPLLLLLCSLGIAELGSLENVPIYVSSP